MLLVAQVGIGSAAVVSNFPLAVALAHNAVAALLLAVAVSLNYQLALD